MKGDAASGLACARGGAGLVEAMRPGPDRQLGPAGERASGLG